MLNPQASRRPASWWRDESVALLQANDWYGLYTTAMGWRIDGGAYTPEAWLMDVCSALLHRQPKTAAHCCDMALPLWVQRPGDRSLLHFVRGLVVADHVGDPRRAVEDLERATHGPEWLRSEAHEELQRVSVAAARSRVRKPRVQPAPAYDQDYSELITNPDSRPPVPDHLPADGGRPELWSLAMQYVRKH
ncbi:hypothetical protein ACF3NT_01005 [Naumannella halotolerans]|uniref:Tetratricopeptide repeat protein n=1 Tax=Naumannella halotolerans TaxID=993414 RepID=A0A4R7J5Y8_9ACTN|nr:hypothetical protein [Naumannella halotolerans]TDT32644.1 hypothetical protein CLV29_0226 [Naumannella halotolerans]